MTLGKKQELFARLYGEFICWIYDQGYALRLGEVHRPKVTAEHYASIGKGIANSAHTRKLAADIFLVKNGKVTWDADDYVELAVHWEGMHKLCRAGLRFKNRDAVHFSLEHQNVK